MRRDLLPLPLIILFAASTALAGMGMSGSVKSKKPDGESFKAVLYGDLMLGPGGLMSEARVKALGQYLLDTGDALNLRSSASISAITETSIDIDLNGDILSFQITPETAFCDFNGERIKRTLFKVETIATVSSTADEKVATSIRKGPLYFTGAMAGSPKLEDIQCVE